MAFSLAAVSLARPAQAHWVSGNPYYDSQNNSSTDANTALTTTPVGNISLTSTPTGGYYGSNAAGSYSGTVDVNYTWTGALSARPSGFGFTSSFAVSGSNNSSGSATSNAGGYHGTTVNAPGSIYSSSGSSNSVFIFQPGDTRTKVTLKQSLGASTTAAYTGSAKANASVSTGSAS